MTACTQDNQYVQGTKEWLQLRKTKITATDASVIMGVNPWKNKQKLFAEKMSETNDTFVTSAMQRGIDLEPIARDLYSIISGIYVEPKVIVKEWAMASLDGISKCGQHIVEIKCPSEKDHSIALQGKVPECYYPQMQHQMYVCDLYKMDYFSFDGVDGVVVSVDRDEDYIENMIKEELKFYESIMNKTPPEPTPNDYIIRDDEIWVQCAEKYKSIKQSLQNLEMEEESMRKQLIFLSGELNTKGAGISLCHVQRKGTVDYSKIPELKNINLEIYRKAPSANWRVTTH